MEGERTALTDLPPPLHTAPVGGGGELELAVPARHAVQAAKVRHQAVLGQVAGWPGPEGEQSARLLAGPAEPARQVSSLLVGRAGPVRQEGSLLAGGGDPARLAAPRGLIGQRIVGRREDDGEAQLLRL